MAPKKGKEKGKEKEKEKEAPAAIKPRKPKPPPACFTADDIARFKETFKAFDEERIDKVKISLIPTMLRTLGFNPKLAEVKVLFETFLEDDMVEFVEFDEYLYMIEAKMKMGDDFEAAVFKAFSVLGQDETETGICDFDLIKEELFAWGEPFTEEEFVEWIKLATKSKTWNMEDGSFRYTKFIEFMNSKDKKYLNEPINYFKLDQKTLAAMALKKANEEKAEQDKKDAETKAKLEAKRQKMIAEGLLAPD